MQRHDGQVRVFPPEGGAYYKVGESPYGVPSGSYLLCFYDEQHHPLPQHDQRFLISLQNEVHQSATSQLPMNFLSAGSRTGAPSTPAGTGAPTAPSAAAASTAASASEEFAALEESDLEFRKHLAALDLEERQQEFIKNSTYIKELGESFVLQRLMRRDMMEMQRTIAHQAKQAFLELGNSKGTMQRLLELQDSVLDHVEKHRYVPPAPPPDYVGLGHAAIGMLKEVGVALIHRYGGERAGLPPAASSHPQPQLPAAGSAPTAAATPAPAPASGGAAPPPDVIDRIGTKLRSLTELDLAKAMSSPETWAGLLQDCLRAEPPTDPTPSEPTQGPSIGLEG
jgi:hypothetical protein